MLPLMTRTGLAPPHFTRRHVHAIFNGRVTAYTLLVKARNRRARFHRLTSNVKRTTFHPRPFGERSYSAPINVRDSAKLIAPRIGFLVRNPPTITVVPILAIRYLPGNARNALILSMFHNFKGRSERENANYLTVILRNRNLSHGVLYLRFPRRQSNLKVDNMKNRAMISNVRPRNKVTLNHASIRVLIILKIVLIQVFRHLLLVLRFRTLGNSLLANGNVNRHSVRGLSITRRMEFLYDAFRSLLSGFRHCHAAQLHVRNGIFCHRST